MSDNIINMIDNLEELKRIKKHNTICLSMIVKNEAKVIIRCLSSLAPLIDYWVISDTGSTDNTIQLIEDYFKSVGIPGEILQHKWIDHFGYSRSIGLKEAKTKAEYTICIDADEIFQYSDDFELPKLTLDSYMIMAHSSNIYKRHLVFNNKFDWEYRGALHEYPYAENSKTIGLLKGIINIVFYDGTSHEQLYVEKYSRHAEILEKELIENAESQNIHDIQRNTFYLANSYKDARNNEKAIENYLKRTQLGGFVDEIYLSYIYATYCSIGLKLPLEQYIIYLFKAYEIITNRLEASFEIVHNFNSNKLPHSAYNFGINIVNNKKFFDIPDGLFINPSIYNYRFLFEVYIAAYNSNHKEDAVKIIERILKEKRYPENMEGEFKRRWDEINIELHPKNITDIFTNIYNKNLWGVHKSGFGNTFDYTVKYRELLKSFIHDNNIKTVLDVGSGVWEFKHNEFDNTNYIGLDCVANIVKDNEQYVNENIKFIHGDIFNMELDKYDLVIVKDVLQHLSFANIIKLLSLLKLVSKYILIVNDGNQNNTNDITDGDYRPLDCDKYPLSIYKPTLIDYFNSKQISIIHCVNKVDKNDNISKIDNCKIDTKTLKDVKKNKVLIAILARNKAHVLPHYLDCLFKLDYPKENIHIYINTNNNTDNTLDILQKWQIDNINNYASIQLENIEQVIENSNDNPHEWTASRFKILGKIRQNSMLYAIQMNCEYYFVIDCDNFITPNTLSVLIGENKSIIAPMLKSVPEPNDVYSNFFTDTDANGYFKSNPMYMLYYNRNVIGTFKVPVVHCTYLIKTEYIPKLHYLDDTNRHEFVIFSESARKNNIEQYLCNKYKFGELLHFKDENISRQDEINRYNDYIKLKNIL